MLFCFLLVSSLVLFSLCLFTPHVCAVWVFKSASGLILSGRVKKTASPLLLQAVRVCGLLSKNRAEKREARGKPSAGVCFGCMLLFQGKSTLNSTCITLWALCSSWSNQLENGLQTDKIKRCHQTKVEWKLFYLSMISSKMQTNSMGTKWFCFLFQSFLRGVWHIHLFFYFFYFYSDFYLQ